METKTFPAVSPAVCLKFWTGWAACDFVDMARESVGLTCGVKLRCQDKLDDVTFVFVTGDQVEQAKFIYRRYRFSERGCPPGVTPEFLEDVPADKPGPKPKSFYFSGTLSHEDWENEKTKTKPVRSVERCADDLLASISPMASLS